MYYLIYTSFATHPFSEDELQALLVQAQSDNQQLQVTGFLYYYSNSFLQLIEGEEETVKTLYELILADTRHRDLIILKDGRNSARFYPDWTMGYRFLNPDELKQSALYPANNGVIDTPAVLRLFEIAAAIE